jgi:hypothetical protein
MEDFILDDNNDMIVENGSFKTDNSLKQETKLIIQGAPGHFRENGYLGLDLLNSLDDENIDIVPELKKMLKLDGKKLNKINFKGDIIQIDADYAD